MVENRRLREVRVLHPNTGELMLVTREEIPPHADDHHRVAIVSTTPHIPGLHIMAAMWLSHSNHIPGSGSQGR